MKKLPLAPVLALILGLGSSVNAEPWKRHAIEAGREGATPRMKGADGVRLADFNGDGLMDLVTGWEESGLVRLYTHPGQGAVTQPWPASTVGRAPSVEDAIFYDWDRDGQLDVISCTEGKHRQLLWHRQTTSGEWETISLLKGQMEMYAEPCDRGLLVGSKGTGATLRWVEPDEEGRALVTTIHPVGWVMTIQVVGDQVLVTDRKGPDRGVWLYEIPEDPASDEWIGRRLGGENHELMFGEMSDADGDGVFEILVATRDGCLLHYQPNGDEWVETAIPFPFELEPGKAVAAGNLGGDGPEWVITKGPGGPPNLPGVFRMSRGKNGAFRAEPISDHVGEKFDRIELLDLDGDGDLDVLTCEERDNLGVIWYENPG